MLHPLPIKFFYVAMGASDYAHAELCLNDAAATYHALIHRDSRGGPGYRVPIGETTVFLSGPECDALEKQVREQLRARCAAEIADIALRHKETVQALACASERCLGELKIASHLLEQIDGLNLPVTPDPEPASAPSPTPKPRKRR